MTEPIYRMTGTPIIENEPVQTDLEAALSLTNIQPIEQSAEVDEVDLLKSDIDMLIKLANDEAQTILKMQAIIVKLRRGESA